MKVIICGAGQVGFHIAHYLAAERNDVTVIDQSPELIRKISDSVDIQWLVGHASHPSALEAAGAADADMLIAVTYADEVNMLACQVAHSLFEVPIKIARVRHQDYLHPHWADLFSRDHLPIDVIISPEIEVARAIVRNLQVPGAIDMIRMAEGKVRVIGVRCHDETPINHTPLRQLTKLFPDLNIVVVGVVRDDRAMVPDPDDRLLPGDEVYFVVDSEHVSRAMAAFGHEEPEARRLVIFGGGHIGLFLAKELIEHRGVSIKVVETNRTRAEYVAGELPAVTVIRGSAMDPEILEEANVGKAQMTVAVTNQDEVNILASMLAKRIGCQRTVALINNPYTAPLVGALAIDMMVSPRAITVSTILQHIRRGRIHAAYSLREGLGEIIEGDALETSSLVGPRLREIKFPPGVKVGAIVRDDEVIMPRGDTRIQAKDRVLMFAAPSVVKNVEKLFTVGLEYF